MKDVSSSAPSVVIAGAGCAGLAAGIALLKRGFQVTIFESLSRVGGLAGGIQINGNLYEYGPHIFHTDDPEILADVKRIAGQWLLPFEKTIKIKFLGKYFDFPLTGPTIVRNLPLKTIVLAAFSFLKSALTAVFQRSKTLQNSEEVLRLYYGDVLYRIFFKDYIIKVWGLEPKEMAASFARQRVPKMNFLKSFDQLAKRFAPRKPLVVKTEDYVEKVAGEHFTTRHGFWPIAESFREEFQKKGGTLHLRTPVTGLLRDSDGGPVRAVEFIKEGQRETIGCDFVVSTLPINRLPGLLRPSLDAPVAAAAKALRFRGIVFVGILVNRAKALPSSFMYFRDRSFNRLTDLSHFGMEIHPEGSTILVAEIMCQPDDAYWIDEAATKKMVVQELESEGLVSSDEVLEIHIFKTENGYPIYEVGYESRLKTALSGVSEIGNVETIGRQGRFAYVNTHIAMKMGYEAAERIAARAPAREGEPACKN